MMALLSLASSEALDNAVERRGVRFCDDLLVLRVAFVLLALLEELAGFAEGFLGGTSWDLRSSAKAAMTLCAG